MLEFYLGSASDFSITDNNGNKYTVEEAKEKFNETVENNIPFDCNLAFQRLVRNNFDLDKVKEFYDNN